MPSIEDFQIPQFDSLFPATAELEAAWYDSSTQRILTEISANDGMETLRVVMHGGILQRLPSTLIQPFVNILKSIVSFVYDQLKEILDNVVKPAIDMVFDAIGSIPYVGPLVRAAFDIYHMFSSLVKKPREKQPPLVSYDYEINQARARRLLAITASLDNDWTPIFLPCFAGDWQRFDRERGYSFRQMDDVGGVGMFPGSNLGLRRINVKADSFHSQAAFYTLSGDLRFPNVRSGVVYTKNRANKIKDFIRNKLKGIGPGGGSGPFGYTFDDLSTTPSVVNGASSAWQAVQTPTLAMYCIDASGIIDTWRESIDDGLDLVRGYAGSDSDRPYKRWRITRWTADVAAEAHLLALRQELDQVCAPAIEDLGRRQREFMRTILCAAASLEQAAFKRSNDLRLELVRQRRELLQSPVVLDVDADDVVDEDFRNAVLQKQRTMKDPLGGRKLLRIGRVPVIDGSDPEPPLPRSPPITDFDMSEIDQGSGRHWGWIAALGALGVAVPGAILARRHFAQRNSSRRSSTRGRRR